MAGRTKHHLIAPPKPPDLRTVLGRLTMARLAAGLTRRQLAYRMGVGEQTIKAKELGYRSLSSDDIGAWGMYTKVRLEWILDGEGKVPDGAKRFDHVQLDGSTHLKHRRTELEKIMSF